MTRKATRKPTKSPSSTTVLLNDKDREAARQVVEAGWATTTSGAIRYALKFVSDHLGGSK